MSVGRVIGLIPSFVLLGFIAYGAYLWQIGSGYWISTLAYSMAAIGIYHIIYFYADGMKFVVRGQKKLDPVTMGLYTYLIGVVIIDIIVALTFAIL